MKNDFARPTNWKYKVLEHFQIDLSEFPWHAENICFYIFKMEDEGDLLSWDVITLIHNLYIFKKYLLELELIVSEDHVGANWHEKIIISNYYNEWIEESHKIMNKGKTYNMCIFIWQCVTCVCDVLLHVEQSVLSLALWSKHGFLSFSKVEHEKGLMLYNKTGHSP